MLGWILNLGFAGGGDPALLIPPALARVNYYPSHRKQTHK